MRSLSDKAGFLIIANFFKYAIGFALPMIVVRLFNRTDYGTYQQLNLLATVTIGLMTIGLPTSIYYFYHQVERAKIPVLIAQTTLMLVLAAGVAGMFLFLFSPWIGGRLHNPAISSLLPTFSLYIALSIAAEHFLPVLISGDRYRLAVGFEVGETVVRVTLVLVPLLLGLGIRGFVMFMAVYGTIRLAARSVVLIVAEGRLREFHWTDVFLRKQLGYSGSIVASMLAGVVSNQFDRALVAASFSPAEFAIYAVGALEIPVDSIFQSSVANVLRASLPPLVRDGNLAEIVRVLRESVRKLSIIVIPGFIFLEGFSREFITTLFTHSYLESVNVFRIYLFLMPLNMFIFSLIPQVFGRPRMNFNVAVVSSTGNVVLNVILLHTLGLFGPAVGAVSSAYLSSAIYAAIVVRFTRASIFQVIPFGALARTATVGGVALLVARLVCSGAASLPGPALLALAGSVFSAVFFVSALSVGVFTEGDRRLAGRWLGRIGTALIK